MLIDSHCHLNFYQPEEVEGVIARAKENGVEKFVDIGTSLDDSELAIKQAAMFPEVFATIGLHPNDNHELTEENIDWQKFETLAKSPKVVAIGECGLDYSRITNYELRIKNEEIDRQKKIFIAQVKLGHKLNLPLSIHIRDAYDDTIELMTQVPHPVKAVFHCMSGTADYLASLINLVGSKGHDFYFSFAGNVTFKNADSIRDLAKLVPLDRLLVETDSPFLTPEPFRGGKNEPMNVRIVADKLAELKTTSLDDFAKSTSINTIKLFKL